MSGSWRDFEIFLHIPQYKVSSPISQLLAQESTVVIRHMGSSENNIQNL